MWEIFRSVIQAEDAFAYLPQTTKDEGHEILMGEAVRSYVAIEGPALVGAYFLKPNQPGLGAHIANAGYMVDPWARGKGIAKAMCLHSLTEAKNAGYLGMQFNLVVATNAPAIRAWESCGFRIIGTTPKAFKHHTEGLVDAHIMFREL